MALSVPPRLPGPYRKDGIDGISELKEQWYFCSCYFYTHRQNKLRQTETLLAATVPGFIMTHSLIKSSRNSDHR